MTPHNPETNSQRRAKPATAAATHRCSYCGTSFERSQSRNMPFCSRRCQEIDLGMWLNESYGLPHEAESDIGDGLRYEDE